MSERVGWRWSQGAIAGGLIAAVSLLAPWARSGRVDRSMFDLISSARALELLSDTQTALVVSAVVLVTLSISISLISAAWDRPRLAALALLVVAPVMLMALVVVSDTPLELRWGAMVGAGGGVLASTCAMIALLSAVDRRRY